MTALVACETVLLVLLTVLVAGLLRSHAELLRRLGPEAGGDEPRTPHAAHAAQARDVAGVTLDGDAAQLGLAAAHAQQTLLAFLSSGCAACRGFFDAFSGGAALPDGVRLVVVAKDASRESPARLRELAGELPLVLSSSAWADYRVPAAPYFVLTGGGVVRGEGSAGGRAQLESLLRDALDDAGEARGAGGERRARRADEALRAAGIVPGDPSLYPTVDRQWSQPN